MMNYKLFFIHYFEVYAAALATHVGAGRIATVHQLVKIQRLALDDERARERVARLQPRGLRLLHHKLFVAQVSHQADATRLPGELHAVAHAQVVAHADARTHHVDAHFLVVMSSKRHEVGVAGIHGQRIQYRVAGLGTAIHVAPYAHQRALADDDIGQPLDVFTQALELGGRVHAAA